MAVTIKQIAQLAGVSRGTVDRALNHRDGVKKEVAERILEIAKELDYRPNAVAKALANAKKNYVIGVLVHSDGNEFFDEVLKGIEQARREIHHFGVTVMLRVMKGFDVEKQLGLISDLIGEGVHALAITPIDDPAVVERLQQVTQSGIPVVTLNADVTGVKKLAFVGCDYLKSGEIAGGLMGYFTQGKACVGIVTGSIKMLGHNLRIQGFREVLRHDFPDVQIMDVVENNDDNETSYERVCELLLKYPQMNALYFTTSGGVKGAVKAVCEQNRQQNMTMITFDETPFITTAMKENRIQATVCQQPFAQGYQSIRILFDYLVEGKTPKKQQIYTQNEIKLKYNL
jgi:LacI family transcriptional regulator